MGMVGSSSRLEPRVSTPFLSNINRKREDYRNPRLKMQLDITGTYIAWWPYKILYIICSVRPPSDISACVGYEISLPLERNNIFGRKMHLEFVR
jgi:hypothetical protein